MTEASLLVVSTCSSTWQKRIRGEIPISKRGKFSVLEKVQKELQAVKGWSKTTLDFIKPGAQRRPLKKQQLASRSKLRK
jgi:hypothetical protein